MAEPNWLSTRLGDISVEWRPDPGGTPAVDVAAEYLQHLIVARLRDHGFTAQDVTSRVGGSARTWSSKFAGHRRITLHDLLALLMAVDSGLGELDPFNASDVGAFFPEPYRTLLSHNDLGQGVPQLLRSSDPAAWSPIVAEIEDWWKSEVAGGRGWSLTRDVLVHKIAHLVHALGLHAAQAAIDVASDATRLTWPVEDVVLGVHWFAPDAPHPSSEELRSHVASAAEALWSMAERSETTKICAIVGADVVTRNLRAGLDEPAAPPNESWRQASLTNLERLGLGSDRADLHYREIPSSGSAPIAWYVLK